MQEFYKNFRKINRKSTIHQYIVIAKKGNEGYNVQCEDVGIYSLGIVPKKEIYCG
jgi:hypothetical protein